MSKTEIKDVWEEGTAGLRLRQEPQEAWRKGTPHLNLESGGQKWRREILGVPVNTGDMPGSGRKGGTMICPGSKPAGFGSAHRGTTV